MAEQLMSVTSIYVNPNCYEVTSANKRISKTRANASSIGQDPECLVVRVYLLVTTTTKVETKINELYVPDWKKHSDKEKQ